MKVIFKKLGEDSVDTVVGKPYPVVEFSVKDGQICAVYIDDSGEDNYHMEETDCSYILIDGE